MINLLPDEYKKDLRSARMNVALLRYNMFAIIAVVVLGVAWGMFSVSLNLTEGNAKAESKKNQDDARQYDTAKKEWEDYNKNLAFAKQILGDQVSYTQAIVRVTELMPKNTVLDNLNLSAQDFGNQVVLSAHAKTRDDALKIKESFEKSDFFSNVFFQSITETDGSKSDYPVGVNISVKINKVKN